MLLCELLQLLYYFYFFSSLCNFDPPCNIVIYFLLVLNFAIVFKVVKFYGCLCMVGAQTCPSPYKRLLIFLTLQSSFFARLRRTTFIFGNFTNFKVVFPMVWMDFP